MPPQYKHPFSCTECQSHPKKDFTIFKKTDCWFMAYPKKNLLHIHYGASTHSHEQSTHEAEFNLKWLKKVTARYPQKKFCFILDLLRKDDAEFISPKAQKIYKEIRLHPQLDLGVIYGATVAMKFIIKMFLYFGKVKTHIVDDEKEARKLYEKWYKKNVKN